MKGELIDFEDWSTGRVRGLPHVFGLGNVLTGKGNIKESRKNAQEIGTSVVQSYLGLWGDAPLERALGNMHSAARDQAELAIAEAQTQPLIPRERLSKIFESVSSLWQRAGYDGDYERWITKVTPGGEEI